MDERTPEQQAEDKIWTSALGWSPKRDFTQRVFQPIAAMVKKEAVDGQRMWTPFNAATFTKEEFDVVEGMWDHEHCKVCWERIAAGDTYWLNSQNFILCPACHEKFRKRG